MMMMVVFFTIVGLLAFLELLDVIRFWIRQRNKR